MSHKAKSGAGASKPKRPAKTAVEGKTEDVLQAVVLVDSFQDRFKPFTVEQPRCLLPLANTPLIEYTLEFLAMNGVEEVYICCGAHTAQVEDYIASSRWSTSSPSSPFTVLQLVRVSNAETMGDVLRDMDKRSLINGDFLLVHGDVVSNLMLGGALAAHRKRRIENAANIMTMVLRSGGLHDHRTKTNAINPIFVVDSRSQRVLHYDEISPLHATRYVSLDPAIPDELSTDFEVRADLIDAQVDICTPEVLALWSESFDCELPRRHFLRGVLTDWELNGKMIYADIVQNGYAARASNLQMYDAVSRDVLDRWTFPFIPENNVIPGQSHRRHANGLVMEAGASHKPDARLVNSVIGRDTSIGAASRISNSVIGRGCRIGANVVIERSYIWDFATIEDGTRISHSILADSVVVGANCSLPEGTLVASRVRIGDGVDLQKGTALTTVSPTGEPIAADTSLLGPDTNAAIFNDGDDDDELDERDPAHLQKSLIYSLAHLNISRSTISTLASDASSDDDADGDTAFLSADASASRSRLSSFASDDSAGKQAFHHDAIHGLIDALRVDTGDFDSAKLEFMGLRLANDASDAMMRRAVATAFARRAFELLLPVDGGRPLEPAKAAERALTARPGAAKFVAEVGVGGDGEPEQVEFVLALQRALTRQHNLYQQQHQLQHRQHASSSAHDHDNEVDDAAAAAAAAASAASAQPNFSASGTDPARAGTLLAAMLQQLYALDIIEEDGILAWWGDERAAEGEAMAALRAKCRPLVEWLEDADEEDDDDDEEEEEDDKDDEDDD